MLNRLSLNQRRPVLGQLNSENNQKQNNQKNLNRIKRSVKHNLLDPSLVIKPIDTLNYASNVNPDAKFIIPVNYNSFQPIEFNIKKTSRTAQKVKSDILVQKQKQKSNTQQFCELYGNEIILDHETKQSFKSQFLQNHEITASLRARMLDWMVEVTKSYKFINKTYFSSVQLMDRYFSEVNNQVSVSKLHILGVTAMLIASKMEQIYPLKYSTVYQKIVHKKISKQELIQTEMQVFQALDHKVNAWTIFDLALLKVHHQISINDQEIKQKLQDIVSFVSKCIMYDYDLYIKFDMDALATVISKISSKICRLPLQKQFICQKQCYQAVMSSLKNFRVNFKGLNNIYKFTDESIVKLVESEILVEKKN